VRLRTTARHLIAGTRWESPAKRLHYLLTQSQNSKYDVQTIEIMRRALAPGGVGVDAGAFEGGMLRHMLRFSPRARHHAFEPIPRLSQRLTELFPTCAVHAAALGESPGTATFREVLETPALSGLRRRVDLPAHAAINEYSVPVETLDHAIPGNVAVAFIKIDVEGGELGVLRGGRETIRHSRPVIVFECGLGGADTYGSQPSDVFDVVTADLGLRLFLLESWLAGQAPLTRDGFVRQFDQGLNYYFVAAP